MIEMTTMKICIVLRCRDMRFSSDETCFLIFEFLFAIFFTHVFFEFLYRTCNPKGLLAFRKYLIGKGPGVGRRFSPRLFESDSHIPAR